MEKQKPDSGKIAVIRIRGDLKLDAGIKNTFKTLNLITKNSCVVLDKTPSNLGLVKKVKDFITWGDIDDETFKLLVEKRGELFNERTEDKNGKIDYTNFMVIDGKKYNKYFRMHPPVGGFERKGVKWQFTQGGALGNRAEKIIDLIKRMI